jgi:uncharacterized membrane protein YgcG
MALAVATVGWLVLAGQAVAVAPEIKDEAKFFSSDAVKKANKAIRDIFRQSGRDFLVETLPAVPSDQAERVKNMSTEERAKFFYNWAQDRADVAVVNGIYILVTREPPHLEILITRKARSVFDQSFYQKLRDTLLKEFRQKHFDEGLLAAVEQMRQQLGTRTKSEP